MNSTLKPNTNIYLCALWSLVVLAGLGFLSPRPFDTVLVTLLVGLIAGALQARALKNYHPELLASETMLDVRRILTRSRAGKASIWLLWLSGAAVFARYCLFNFKPNAILYWFVGYAGFALGRDLMALPTVLELSRPRDS